VLEPIDLINGIVLRPLSLHDAGPLAAAYSRNRSYLAPWEPTRTDEFFTEAWQSKHIASTVASAESDSAYFLGLFDGTEVVGRFTLSRVVRASFQSAGLGYWVDERYADKGLATAAVTAILARARDNLGLHRVEASTVLHNLASQRVLVKAGFQQIGMAPKYLKIAGSWQDHNLYQAILHD
jgi:ribosomal-protein-alanine N-acetyltransferase